MSGDLVGIENELVRLSSALFLLTEEFEGICLNAANSRCEYDVQWAKALLRAGTGSQKSTQKDREAEATLACENFMREARINESIRDAAKERIRALESLLTVHQSRLRYLDEGKRTF